ncbi:hypothetical protein [Comamonas composti]|uniref:hypothetical protein n=1 Tax=Comamonas composti TaxID=408558 RepID=UPI001FE2193B|nr:hypothetical protein [Comamonas composti]
MRRRLQQRHWLRLHALMTGTLSLGLMLFLSHALLHAGVHSMALRYGLALGGGYVLYLLLVRLWAGCMLSRDWTGDLSVDSGSGSGGSSPSSASAARLESGEGGSFGGGGASGQWDGAASGEALQEPPSLADLSSSPGFELPGLDAVDFDLEGVVLVPVLLLFAGLLVLATGAGSLLWLVLGSELFLAVAVEVAFALLMARTLYVVEREGWLLAALRLSYKPMLGVLVAAVMLGALADWLLPGADTLAQVFKVLRGG